MAACRCRDRFWLIALLLVIVSSGTTRLVRAAETAGSAPPKFEWNVFLGDWQVIGPIPKLARDQMSSELDRALVENEGELRPDKPIQVGDKSYAWHQWPGRFVDFIAALNADLKDSEHAIGYAYAEFTSPAEMEAILGVGHDDCARVWLNGKEVHRSDAWVASELDQGTSKVKLKKGTNRLLAKVTQGRGNWEFAARLRPADVEKPLITINTNGSTTGNMARLPLLEVDLLDDKDGVLSAWKVSGGRAGGSGARYTLFAAAPAPLPAKIRVHFDAPGFEAYEKSLPWKQVESGSVWVSLNAKGKLQGRVVDEKTGEPIAGAEMLAGRSPVAKPTDADGRFEFTMKDPLADIVEVRAAGHEPRQVRAVHEGEWLVKLAPGGHTFRGRVLTSDGKPIAGARIAGNVGRRDLQLLTDEEGKFEISGLPSDDNELYPTVTHPDFVAKDGFGQPLDADGTTDVEWRLEAGCVIEGRVTDKQSGEPLSGIQIVSGTDHFASNVVNPETYTDQEGRFRLGGVEAGQALVHAFTHDFAPAVLTTNTSLDKPARLEFALDKGKPISGRVVIRRENRWRG
jgi:hypothetical protein